jgi:acyl-CoA reductase-like NAD-dependent aldehyde dehydrogenase
MTDSLTVSMPTETADAPVYQYYAGGEWRNAADGGLFESYEPYTGRVFARVAAGGPREMSDAITAAHEAFPAWAAMPPAKKAALLLNAAEIIKRRTDEIADMLARETGSTLLFSQFQQELVADTLKQAAGWVYLPKGEVLQSNVPGTHSVGVRRPLGVVVSFTPWNGANILSWRAVLSPIAAGNTVVVKPSEFAPVNAGLLIAEVAEEAGFPAGVINVVPHAPGAARAIADEVFARREVRVINLIGGVKTAQLLAERAGRTLKRTVLELGGYNPMLILDDVDMDYAVRTATFGSFFHQGQICLNTRKIIIARSRYDEFLEKFVAHTKTLPSGDPLDPKTIIGPLVTPAAVQLVHERVQDAVTKGATVQTGATYEGQIYQPTILTDVSYDAVASNEETFGPLVIVEPVDSDEHAAQVANRVNYGLTSSILTSDTFRGFELAQRIEHGIVNVNSPTVNDEIHAPMGGVKDSGWGRTGPDSIADFSDVIWINARSGQREYPF